MRELLIHQIAETGEWRVQNECLDLRQTCRAAMMAAALPIEMAYTPTPSNC